MVPATLQRAVRRIVDGPKVNTRDKVNDRLARSIAYHIHHPERIDRRLHKLDREWDAERVLLAKAATLSVIGVTLATRDRRWLALPATIAAFMLQHAVQGWCPPSAMIRRMGFRTPREITRERQLLQALQGNPRAGMG